MYIAKLKSIKINLQVEEQRRNPKPEMKVGTEAVQWVSELDRTPGVHSAKLVQGSEPRL